MTKKVILTPDVALRTAINIVAQSYRSRGDHDGDLIYKVLSTILSCATKMDEAAEVGPDDRP